MIKVWRGEALLGPTPCPPPLLGKSQTRKEKTLVYAEHTKLQLHYRCMVMQTLEYLDMFITFSQ